MGGRSVSTIVVRYVLCITFSIKFVIMTYGGHQTVTFLHLQLVQELSSLIGSVNIRGSEYLCYIFHLFIYIQKLRKMAFPKNKKLRKM